jgi:hypothetical protein
VAYSFKFIFDELARRLNTEMVSLEEETLGVMAQQGLSIHQVAAQAAERWRGIVAESIHVVLGRIIPRESYNFVADLVSRHNTGYIRKE